MVWNYFICGGFAEEEFWELKKDHSNAKPGDDSESILHG